MRRLLLSMLLTFASAAFAEAQEMTGKVAQDTKREILDLETAKGKDLVKTINDAADWQERFNADGLALTLPDGSTPTKAELVARIRSGEIKDEYINHHDYHVHVYGAGNVPHTAVVTWMGDEITVYKGKREHIFEKTTDVFVKVDGGLWKRAVHHVSPVPPGIVALN
jgi:hypothetical protein